MFVRKSSMLHRVVLLSLLSLALAATVVAQTPVSAGSVLTSARQVRQLSPEDVALSPAVHIRGVVTYYDPVGPNLFVQDSTGGLWVDSPRGLKDPPSVGQLLDVTGTVMQGFMPYVGKASWKILGTAPMPKPIVVTYADIATATDDSQWVQMQGIVRSFVKEVEDDVLVMDVA